ncbi:hypothetical protein BRC89_04080 [Halobacteriales archaeon QS_4_70_19]|nr:MAG: hypothetical protein BRC89_04080 [Halobacteriales archaeon QS_4_70_19]
MVGVQSVAEGLIRTFGPFLIPVTVFAIGAVGYTILYLVNRQLRPEDEESVVNLSAGSPERSTTSKDHGASTRGVLPYGGDESADDAGAPGAGDGDTEPEEADERFQRADEDPRHND